MDKKFKIEIVEDETGKVVKTLSYETDREREKAFSGLMRQINLDDYTPRCVEL